MSISSGSIHVLNVVFCHFVTFFLFEKLGVVSDAVLEVGFRKEEPCKRGGAGVGPRLVFFRERDVWIRWVSSFFDYSLGTLETAYCPFLCFGYKTELFSRSKNAHATPLLMRCSLKSIFLYSV
jgi:hypothetical protein